MDRSVNNGYSQGRGEILAKKGKGTILVTGGALAMYPSADYLIVSIGKAGIRAMTGC